MTDKPSNWVVCPGCTRFVLKSTEEEAQQIAADHNESMHDGVDVAQTMPETKEAVNKLEKDGRELLNKGYISREQYDQLIRKLANEDPLGVIHDDN